METTDTGSAADCIEGLNLCFVNTAIPTIVTPYAARGGDLSASGKQELLVVDLLPGDLWRIAATNDGYMVDPPLPLGLSGNPRIYLTNLDGDPFPDLLSTGAGSHYSSLNLTGTFQPGAPFELPPGAGGTLAPVDTNGDGITELLQTVDLAARTAGLWRQENGEWILGPERYPIPGCGSVWDSVTADFNGDRIDDLALVGWPSPSHESEVCTDLDLHTANVFLSLPESSTLTLSHAVPLLIYPHDLAAGDFDGDGDMDLASGADFRGVRLSVVAGRGDGTFMPATQLIEASTIFAGDLDGDGDDELLVYRYGGLDSEQKTVIEEMTVIDDPLGAYQAHLLEPYSGTPLALSDLNGDGRDDIVYSHLDPNIGHVLNVAASSAP